MVKKKTKKQKVATAQIPIEWNVPDGLMTPFATNMLVQSMEHEFKISFFEMKPTIRFNVSDPVPNTMRADYVAGVIVSAERLPKFIKALEDQLEKYKSVNEK